MERHILVVIETILRAEEALQGLSQLKALLQVIAEVLRAAGIEQGAQNIAEAMMRVGEAGRAVDTLISSLADIAAFAPQAAAGMAQTATATREAAAAAKEQEEAARQAEAEAQAAAEAAVRRAEETRRAFISAARGAADFFGWLSQLGGRLHITSSLLDLLRQGLSTVGGFFISVGRSIFDLINPLNWVIFTFNQLIRSVRILTALLLFQFFRKMESVIAEFANAIIGANIQTESFRVRMRALVGEADRAEAYFTIVREASIATGFALGDLAQATFRFASVAGHNMEVFRELVARTVQLAFFDPVQGIAGAGLAIMEAMTGQFRSLVRRFEIGTLEMATQMKEAGFTNLEILRAMMEAGGVGARIVEEAMESLAGMAIYLQGVLRELARRFGEPIFDFFKSEIRTVRDWVRDHRFELEAWARALGMFFAKIFEDILGLFYDLMGAIRPQDWVEWGLNLMHSFASGILSGAEFVLNTVITIASLIADFLMALSPPEKGPLSRIFEGGAGLIREWIRGMESEDLSAIERIASYAMAALSLLQARGALAEEAMYAAGQRVYEVLTLAVRQLRELGAVSEDLIAGLRNWFGDLFGDVNEYLQIYERILDIQVEIEAREAAVTAAEDLIEAQQIIVDQERKIVEQAQEQVDLAKEALDLFRLRTKGIPARFLAQRERELEMMVYTAEAEVKAREERLEAAEEELDERKKNLELAREFLDQAKEQQKIFADQLKSLEAQMSMMQRIWAWQEKGLKEEKEREEEYGEGAEERSKREEELKKKAEEFYKLITTRLEDLRGRYDALFAVARGFLMYEAPEGAGLLGTIARVEEGLGRKLTPAELEAVEKGWLLRDSLSATRSELDRLLTPVLEFAKGLLGISEAEEKRVTFAAKPWEKFGEGQKTAREKGEEFRESLDRLWKETLVPLLEGLWSFIQGLAGIGTKEEATIPRLWELGEVWRSIGTNLFTLTEFLVGLLATPTGMTVAGWGLTFGIFLEVILKLLGPLFKVGAFLALLVAGMAAGQPIAIALGKVIGALALIMSAFLAGTLIAFLPVAIGTFIRFLIETRFNLGETLKLWIDFWGRFLETAVEWAGKFLAWLGFHSFFTDLLSAFESGFARLLTWLGDLLPDFWGLGQDLIRNIISGADSLLGVDFQGLVQRIADLWPFSLAKKGPFRVPIRWEYFTEGLQEQLQAAERALTSFAQAEVAPAISGALAPPLLGAARGLVEIHIHNDWDASITAKDRQELSREMYITAYKALDRAFEEARG